MAGDRTSAALEQQRAQQQAQQRAAELRAAQQRVHQTQLAQQAQQRQAQQRLAQQRQAQRQAQQRQHQAQQRQAQQRLQQRQREAVQRRAAEVQRREAQRLRIWRSTAAKRAARQVETELAIEEREERQRLYEAAAVATPLKLGRPALRRQYMQAPVDVGDLDVPLVRPRREQFGRGGWLPWQRAARERREAEAESAYEAAVAAYEAAEFDRVRRLSTAKRDHQRRQAEAADRLWADYQAGDADAVARYAAVVLTSRHWPTGFGSSWQVQYEPDGQRLAVEYELPAQARSADSVAQIALRVLFDLFRALDAGLVDVISFNGLAVSGPSLVSVTVTRERWAAKSMFDDDAQTVLRELDRS